MENANKIISKILKSDFFKKNLKEPNARVAQILFKLVRYLGRSNKENHQTCLTNSTNLKYEAVGLNSKITLNLLYTVIDEKLVNFSKWHIFKAFEILAGKKFEDLYVGPSLKRPNYILKKIYTKMLSKYKNLPMHNSTFAMMQNKYFKDFIKSKKFLDTFNDFKNSHTFKDIIYDFPKEDELDKIENTKSNFWKINNIANIVNKIQK